MRARTFCCVLAWLMCAPSLAIEIRQGTAPVPGPVVPVSVSPAPSVPVPPSSAAPLPVAPKSATRSMSPTSSSRSMKGDSLGPGAVDIPALPFGSVRPSESEPLKAPTFAGSPVKRLRSCFYDSTVFSDDCTPPPR